MNTQFNAEQVRLLDECASIGFNSAVIKNPDIDAFKIRVAIHTFRNGNDLTPYLEKFNIDQLEEIRIGLLSGIDVTLYAKTDLPASEMHLIRCQLEDKLLTNGSKV